jgi:hypothetical protein
MLMSFSRNETTNIFSNAFTNIVGRRTQVRQVNTPTDSAPICTPRFVAEEIHLVVLESSSNRATPLVAYFARVPYTEMCLIIESPTLGGAERKRAN